MIFGILNVSLLTCIWTHISLIQSDTIGFECSIIFPALWVAALTDLISSYIVKVDGGWQCTECARTDTKGHLVEHVETSHLDGVEYFCQFCGIKKSSRATLRRHVNYSHKNENQ